MDFFILLILRLVCLYYLASKASGATIEGVRLIGDSNDYINIRSPVQYVLRCSFRSGYDDPVYNVNWYKDNDGLVYTWREGETISTASRPLTGAVATSTKNNLENLHFNNRLSSDLEGHYTCEVNSRNGRVRSQPYHLVILDIPSEEYVSNVTLLSDKPEEETEFEDEDSNCTLLWNFQTPAIFPRPNVTCGYYSYLHDDVTDTLPAGLTMHLLNNGSWQAGFEHTHIQVSEIPRERRLGCAVSVPDTTYKKVVKFEDNFAIDYLIDSEGCPSMFLDPSYGMKFTYVGGSLNCRGDLVPTSREEPLNIKFGCEEGDVAVFSNGTVLSYWSTEMTCDPMDLTWRRVEYGKMSIPVRDIENEVPMCVSSANTVDQFWFSAKILFSLYVMSRFSLL